ncbi:MAG: ABC transporter permease [Deltaproteobacteria bacterium]|nr:ABC transporter permease [Deltaproteobacteria bacterium]
MDMIRRLGGSVILIVSRIGLMGLFLIKTVFYIFIPPLKFYRLLKQIRFIGAQSSFVIILTGLFTGMVLGLQGFRILEYFGSDALLGPTVALPLIKEMGPVLAALMVTARAGSALTAEIGIMRISEQIDALELMGLSPYRYLFVPNLLAAIISLPLLTAFFDVIGIYGGYLVGVKLLGLGGGVYFGEMATSVDMKDITEGIFKSLSFGVIIAWVSCFKGFYVQLAGQGAEGVSKATTQSVVLSAVLILVWDYVMTSIFF